MNAGALLHRHRGLAALAAATVAMFVFANLRSPLPNDDGVLYLMLADQISQRGLAAAFEYFDRPLYSAMIAAVHALGGLSWTAAAHLLNGACVVGLVLAFTGVCRELYGDARIMPWAAALLLAHPKLNNYFAFVVRDIGYWAFLMAALLLLLRRLGGGGRRTLAGWALCTLAAAAFKPEAMIFGLLLPLAFPLGAGRRGLPDALFAWAALGLPLALFVLLAGSGTAAIVPSARELPQLPGELLGAIPAVFAEAAARYAASVLDPYSRDVAALSLAGGLLTILAIKLLNAVGPAQWLLMALGARAGALLPNRPQRGAWALMLLGGLLLAGLFVAYRQFLDTRYVMIPCVLLLAPAARALQHLHDRARQSGGLRARAVPALIALLLLADLGLGLDRSKPHMLACVAWLRENLQPGDRLFTNDKQIAAASGARWDWNELQGAPLMLAEGRAPLGPGVLWVIRTREGQEALSASIGRYSASLQPLMQFTGEDGDRVVVLRPVPVPAPAEDSPPEPGNGSPGSEPGTAPPGAGS